MSACGTHAKHVGALKDDAYDQDYCVFIQPNTLASQDSTSLSDLLRTSYRPGLTRRQRYGLALAVSSSHLQLQSTPWITRQWKAADVRFPGTGQDVALDQPFVSAEFRDANAPQNQQATKTTDRAFTSLGIMLLELCSRSLLEDSEWWQRLSFTNSQKQQSIYRQIVAKNWADDVEEEEGPEMASAIMWCLNESPKSLDGDGWRRDLAERVIVPVQNCCQYLNRR